MNISLWFDFWIPLIIRFLHFSLEKGQSDYIASPKYYTAIMFLFCVTDITSQVWVELSCFIILIFVKYFILLLLRNYCFSSHILKLSILIFLWSQQKKIASKELYSIVAHLQSQNTILHLFCQKCVSSCQYVYSCHNFPSSLMIEATMNLCRSKAEFFYCLPVNSLYYSQVFSVLLLFMRFWR